MAVKLNHRCCLDTSSLVSQGENMDNIRFASTEQAPRMGVAQAPAAMDAARQDLPARMQTLFVSALQFNEGPTKNQASDRFNQAVLPYLSDNDPLIRQAGSFDSRLQSIPARRATMSAFTST
ncbi:MAG: hypothetical protein MO853_11170 [Candidatus Protistobacter heckmanni]|nr:hypothetical protein [Candidatus Protistobacter heckmanni]